MKMLELQGNSIDLGVRSSRNLECGAHPQLGANAVLLELAGQKVRYRHRIHVRPSVLLCLFPLRQDQPPSGRMRDWPPLSLA